MTFAGAVDLKQLRALVRASLRSEWRISSSYQSTSKGKKISKWWVVWSSASYLLVGTMLGAVMVRARTTDELVVATSIFSLYVGFVTTANILISFGTGFLSPQESAILAPFPITSETFFASRIAVLLVYSLAVASLITIAPAVLLAAFTDATLSPIVAAIGLASALTSSMFTVLLYGVVLSRLDRRKLSKVFGWLQFLASFLTVGSFLFLPRLLDGDNLDLLVQSTSSWLPYTPAQWFGSWVLLTRGEAAVASGMFAGCAVLMIGGSVAAYRILAWRYRSILEEIAESAVIGAKNISERQARHVAGSSDGGFIMKLVGRSFEGRAMWRLFRAQFRYDTKFKMSLLSTLPITFIYFGFAVVNGNVRDPFEAGLRPVERIQFDFLYVVALLSPLLMMQQLSQSESYKASWIFYANPVEREKLILSVRNIIVSFILTPYLAVLVSMFSFFMPVHHAAMHIGMIGSVALIIFQFFLLVSPRIPFSEQRKQQRNFFSVFMLTFLVMSIPLALLMLIMYFSYSSTTRYVEFLALTLTFAVGMEYFVRDRLRKKLETLEYQG